MKRRKLNTQGKFVLVIFILLFFIGIFYVIDKIRFEINKGDINESFTLNINGTDIYPSLVISKKNYIFNHYDSDYIDVEVPHNSIVNIPSEYELLNSQGQPIKFENYLPDGKYTLSFKIGDYSYHYKLNVDNVLSANLDLTYAFQGGFIVASLFDNNGEEYVIDTSFKTSEYFNEINNQIIIPIDYSSSTSNNEITFRTKKGVSKLDVEIGSGRVFEENLYIPDYQFKQLSKEEEDQFEKAINVKSLEKMFTNFIDPAQGYTTGQFGDVYTINNDSSNLIYHLGHDFASAEGTVVKSSASGVVRLVDSNEVFGNYVVVDHGYGITTVYKHLLTTMVSKNDVLNVGQEIGTMGATGNVSGVHLHFEVRINGINVNPNIFLNNTLNF